MEEAAMIIIQRTSEGVALEVKGTCEPGSGTLLERLCLAALAGIDVEMKKLEEAGEFGEPIVSGDARAIEQSVYSDARRMPTHPDYWS